MKKGTVALIVMLAIAAISFVIGAVFIYAKVKYFADAGIPWWLAF